MQEWFNDRQVFNDVVTPFKTLLPDAVQVFLMLRGLFQQKGLGITSTVTHNNKGKQKRA